MLTPFKLLVPPVVGAVLAVPLMFGVVSSQTALPDKNPAESPVLTYGDR